LTGVAGFGICRRVNAADEISAPTDVELSTAMAELAKVSAERDEYRKLVMHLREEVERLRRGLLGQKAERLPKNDAQLSLAILEMAFGNKPNSDAPEKKQKVGAHERRAARKPLPAELPRVTIEIQPPEVEREGRDAFECIGSERREVLERRSASSVVVELVYPKYVRKDRERNAATKVLVADAVELPIPRGIAGPGMLAETVVRRFDEHQPLHRLEGSYSREHMELARSTMCGWHEELAALAEPLVAAMFADALVQPYLCVDATGVLVQAPERCHNGHFWVLVAPERHVLYRYSRRHDSNAVDDLLPGYKGYLVADGHVVYDHLYRTGNVVEVGCWAHTRRYFYKAMASDPERAKVAMTHIGALFAIERSLIGSPRKKKREGRLQKSKPVADAFFSWCEAEFGRVLEESPIFDGLRYALNQREALLRFLENADLPIHNNWSELNLRRQVVGRRNWLFVGSDDGAEVNTIFVSLLASCRLHGIESLAYMRDLFCLLPSWPKSRVLQLAPVNWKQTFEQPETQQALARNVFRRVVLGL
jgi:transposase